MSKRIAAVLREAIRANGISAGALAKKTGVPQTTITRFLAGKDMRLSRAEKIAAHLKLHLKRDR